MRCGNPVQLPVAVVGRRVVLAIGFPAVRRTLTIADGGYPGTGHVPHRHECGQTKLAAWKEEHNRSHKQVRAPVEHVVARMETWKTLRDCRLKGDGVHHAMLGIARMHNLALTG